MKRYVLLNLVNQGASQSFEHGMYFDVNATIEDIEKKALDTFKMSTLVSIKILTNINNYKDETNRDKSNSEPQ